MDLLNEMDKNDRKKEGFFHKYFPQGHYISWVMLFITTLSMLMTSVSRQVLPTVLPAIMDEYQLSASEVGLISSFLYMGICVGSIFFGIYADHTGKGYRRSRPWVYTVIIAAVGGIAVAYSRVMIAMKMFLGLLGIGTGGSEPINVAIVGEWWPKEHRGFAVGFHHIGFPLGQFVGPVIIGFVLAVATWHEAFMFVPLLAIPLAILQLIFGTKKNQERVYKWIEEKKLTVPYVEKDNEVKPSWTETLSYMKLCLQNKNCLYAIAIFFGYLYVEVGIMTFLTLQLTNVGIALATAAVISGASGLTGWIGQILWGTISDSFGRKFSLKIITIGFLLAVLACIFIQSELTGWIILIGWGLFRNSPYPVTYAVLLDSLPKGASSALGLMVGLGWFVSALSGPIEGWIIQMYGFTTHYIFLAILTGCTFFLVTRLKETVVAAQKQ